MDSARALVGFLVAVSAVALAAAPPPPPRLDRHGEPLPAGVSMRLGSLRDRTPQPPTALAVSPDGSLFALLHRYGLRVQETTSRRERLRFVAPLADPATSWPAGGKGSLAFSADGRSLRALCPDGRLRTWDLRSGEKVADLALLTVSRRYDLPGVTGSFSADGRLVVAQVISDYSGASVFECKTGKRICQIDDARVLPPIALTPD